RRALMGRRASRQGRLRVLGEPPRAGPRRDTRRLRRQDAEGSPRQLGQVQAAEQIHRRLRLAEQGRGPGSHERHFQPEPEHAGRDAAYPEQLHPDEEDALEEPSSRALTRHFGQGAASTTFASAPPRSFQSPAIVVLPSVTSRLSELVRAPRTPGGACTLVWKLVISPTGRMFTSGGVWADAR